MATFAAVGGAATGQRSTALPRHKNSLAPGQAPLEGIATVSPKTYAVSSSREKTNKMGITSRVVVFGKRSPQQLGGHSGAEGIRTPDLRLAKAAFSQLNYGPSTHSHTESATVEWAFVDSNHRPSPYQRDALTS